MLKIKRPSSNGRLTLKKEFKNIPEIKDTQRKRKILDFPI
jgi:hypothetical protein